jgi:hypothetical protein
MKRKEKEKNNKRKKEKKKKNKMLHLPPERGERGESRRRRRGKLAGGVSRNNWKKQGNAGQTNEKKNEKE